MAHLFVESADGERRTELIKEDDGGWVAFCDRHPDWRLPIRSGYSLNDAYEESASHVDQH